MSSSSIVAVVDIGSNSTKALIAWLHEDLALRKIAEESYGCRLFDSENLSFKSIPKCAIQKLEEVLEKLFIRCSQEKVSKVAIVATEAIRRAENKTEVIDRIEKKFGFKLKVLTGQDEAFYIAKGVQLDSSIASVKGFQAFDLGGGSLELIEYRAESEIKAKSLSLGVLSLVAEFQLEQEKALPRDIEEEMREMLGTRLNQAGLIEADELPLVGMGGAIVFLRKILASKKGTSFEKLSEFSICDISALTRQVSQMNLEERIVKFPELPLDRVDVLPVACIIVEAILLNLGRKKLLHSFSNLRYGIASSWLTNPGLFQFSDK